MVASCVGLCVSVYSRSLQKNDNLASCAHATRGTRRAAGRGTRDPGTRTRTAPAASQAHCTRHTRRDTHRTGHTYYSTGTTRISLFAHTKYKHMRWTPATLVSTVQYL